MMLNTPIDDQVKEARKRINEKFTQTLIPKRFIPNIPVERQHENLVYIFDSADSFNLTFDELVEIVDKARCEGNFVPVIGTVE